MASDATSTSHKLIGEILVEEGLINSAQLVEAVQKQKQTGKNVTQELVNLGHLDIDQFAVDPHVQVSVSHSCVNDDGSEIVVRVLPKHTENGFCSQQ